MSTLTSVFSDIANAIRSKTGTTSTYKPTTMASAINGIIVGKENSVDVHSDYLIGVNEVTLGSNSHPNLSGNTTNFAATYASMYVGKNVTDLSNSFNRCYNLNVPVYIAKGVTNMAYTFCWCNTFNQSVTIPESVTNMVRTFDNCSNLNSPVHISDNVTSMVGTFAGCPAFDKPITIPSKVTAITSMVAINESGTGLSSGKFNQSLFIPDSVTEMSAVLYHQSLFNKSVSIGNNVVNMRSSFGYCSNYNQPTIIPASVVDMNRTFINCIRFNQSVTFKGTNIDTMERTFYNCINFNQPITIPTSVHDMSYTFYSCINFNQQVIIPSSVISAYAAFWNCNSLNARIYVNSATNVASMMTNCKSFGNNIYFKNSGIITNCKNMLNGHTKTIRKNIFCSNATPFLGTTTSNSICGASVTWTTMTNGYYNATQNIYIYNNYTG